MSSLSEQPHPSTLPFSLSISSLSATRVPKGACQELDELRSSSSDEDDLADFFDNRSLDEPTTKPSAPGPGKFPGKFKVIRNAPLKVVVSPPTHKKQAPNAPPKSKVHVDVGVLRSKKRAPTKPKGKDSVKDEKVAVKDKEVAIKDEKVAVTNKKAAIKDEEAARRTGWKVVKKEEGVERS